MKILESGRRPLIEGIEQSPVWLERKEGEAWGCLTCGQMPGKGQICRSTLEGHEEDFELYPKSNGQYRRI